MRRAPDYILSESLTEDMIANYNDDTPNGGRKKGKVLFLLNIVINDLNNLLKQSITGSRITENKRKYSNKNGSIEIKNENNNYNNNTNKKNNLRSSENDTATETESGSEFNKGYNKDKELNDIARYNSQDNSSQIEKQEIDLGSDLELDDVLHGVISSILAGISYHLLFLFFIFFFPSFHTRTRKNENLAYIIFLSNFVNFFYFCRRCGFD
jgi:hypothetical protein